MIKRLIATITILFLICLLFEAISLLRLKNSVEVYAAFWNHKSRLEGDFVYVALGDSTAQSVGASAPLKGYVGLIAAKIEQKTNRKVRIVNLSVSGATVKSTIDSQLPKLSDFQPDLVTIEIGANDVARGEMTGFEAAFEQLSAQLPPNTFVANMPYFGGRIRRNSEALQAGSIIAALAKRHHLKSVDLQTPLREQQSLLNYSADLFHPSDRAYRIWAKAFWKEIEPTL